METIPKSDCHQVGFIRKTHGVHGELIMEFETKLEESVSSAKSILLAVDGLLVPFYIKEEGLRIRSARTAIVQLEWVDTESKARRLVGNEIYLFKHEIVEADDDSVLQFLNYHLHDVILGEIGIITAVDNYSGNIVFTVDSEGKEILIPYNEELVINVDYTNLKMVLRLPEGLVEE